MKIASLPLCLLAAFAGLAGGGFAGWATGVQQRSQANEERVRSNHEKTSLARLGGGDLGETLRLQQAGSPAEEQQVAAYFESRDAELQRQLAGGAADAGKARDAVGRMSALLPPLQKRKDGIRSSNPAVPETLLAEAREAAGFPGSTADWPGMKATLAGLSSKLSKPIHIKDKPALEAEVANATGEASVKSLPTPEAWEAEKKASLERWRKSKATP